MDRAAHISISIIANQSAWEQVLNQIGVQWTVHNNISEAVDSHPGMIIVNRRINDSEQALIREYAVAGGIVLYTTEESTHVDQRSTTRKYVRSLMPALTHQYQFYEVLDLFHHVYMFEDGGLTMVEPHGDGLISYFGVDIAAAMNTLSIKRKDFYADTDRLPNERVSRISRNTIRRMIQSHLEYLFHRQNLPFVHKWYFPGDSPSLFTFRVDTDKGTQEQIGTIHSMSERHSIPTSWFLDVKSHQDWLEYFTRFSRQEVGVHCFEHVIYSDEEGNTENFRKAKSLLEQFGLHPKGMTAPTGEWNNTIGCAIEEVGFEYSSEFGYDYDNFPSFPIVKGRISSVLQLPVHPVCIGSLIRSGMSTRGMVGYFLSLIDRKMLANEPICLYHHPTHAHNEVFEEVFQYIHSLHIPTVTYAEYGKWWRLRQSQNFFATYTNNRLRCQYAGDDRVHIRISKPDGTESITAIKPEIDLNNLSSSREKPHAPIAVDIGRTRNFSIRRAAQDLLDWWIKITE